MATNLLPTLTQILQAQNRRSIARVPLEKMPKPAVPAVPILYGDYNYHHNTTESTIFVRSNATATHDNNNWKWPVAMVCHSTKDNNTVDEDSESGDDMPELVYGDGDDDLPHNVETLSICSSNDDNYQFCDEHFEHEDMESA